MKWGILFFILTIVFDSQAQSFQLEYEKDYSNSRYWQEMLPDYYNLYLII